MKFTKIISTKGRLNANCLKAKRKVSASVQKPTPHRVFFSAARRNMAVRGLFSRWLSERQIMNEHPRARALPQPLLPTPSRAAFPRPPPIHPGVNRWALARMPPTPTPNLARPGTSIVLVIVRSLMFPPCCTLPSPSQPRPIEYCAISADLSAESESPYEDSEIQYFYFLRIFVQYIYIYINNPYFSK